MSVTNGMAADQNTFNGAFVSKTTDSTVISRITLNRVASGAQVTDVQATLNDIGPRLTQAETDIDSLETRATDLEADVAALQSSTPLSNFSATSDPIATNDLTEGYSVGSRWINTSTDKIFVAVDVSTGAAVWIELGSGGGGGAGTLAWQNGPIAPVNKFSSGFDMASFSTGDDASLVTVFITPPTYTPGDQLTMVGGKIIGEGTDNVAFEVEATLLVDGELITDTTNQRLSTSADIAQTSNVIRPLGNFSITDSVGEINGVPIAPGDLIRIELYRVPASVTESTDDCSIIRNSMFITTL